MTSADTRELIHTGRTIRNAIAFNPTRQGTSQVGLESILQTVDDLFDLLDEREIDYVLVGGIAMLQYVEGRNTEVIHLIMALSALRKAPEIHVDEQDMFIARGRYRDLKIDVLLTDNRLFRLVGSEYVVRQPFAEREIPCATVEGLLLLKLYALPSLYREGDFARVGLYENDIATLIQAYSPDVSTLLEILRSYLGESDLAEVRSIAQEIQQRIDRFGRSFRA